MHRGILNIVQFLGCSHLTEMCAPVVQVLFFGMGKPRVAQHLFFVATNDHRHLHVLQSTRVVQHSLCRHKWIQMAILQEQGIQNWPCEPYRVVPLRFYACWSNPAMVVVELRQHE